MNDYNVINTPSVRESDWNAKEGESGYIKNRTHYETMTEENIGTTVTVPSEWNSDDYPEYIYNTGTVDNNFKQSLYDVFIAGAEDTNSEVVFHSSGKIRINGTEHDCYWYIYVYMDGDIILQWTVYCLDSADISFDGDWPFQNYYFTINASDEMEINTNYIPIGENNIKLTASKIEIKKIDEKFLPTGLQNIKDAENGGIIEGVVEGVEGQVNVASGMYAHVEGGSEDSIGSSPLYSINQATGDSSHAEGVGTRAYGNCSHAEGQSATASEYASHAEGNGTTASGENSHAEGTNATASGWASHAEGSSTTASGSASHAEGGGTTASGDNSHAEGNGTTASGMVSHAEGQSTTASGRNSHAEGESTKVSGRNSHAEGYSTTASGMASHAEGYGTTANHSSQHVFGEFNVEDPSTANKEKHGNYVEIVGNGTSLAKSNARTLDWSGNEWISGTMRAENGFILKSPDGSLFTLTVANDGTLTATKNV